MAGFGSLLECPIIYTDTSHHAILFINTPTMRDTAGLIFIEPYLAIIANEVP